MINEANENAIKINKEKFYFNDMIKGDQFTNEGPPYTICVMFFL